MKRFIYMLAFAVAIVLLFLLALAEPLKASPYFRLINPAHPQVNAGVWADIMGGKPDFGSSVAIITHSTKDGSLFETLQADWALLTLGGGYGDGQAFMAAGPSANLAPAVKQFILKGLDIVAPDRFHNVRSLLAPPPGSTPDITVSFGPQILFRPVENGVLLGPDKYRGRFRFFLGSAWKF